MFIWDSSFEGKMSTFRNKLGKTRLHYIGNDLGKNSLYDNFGHILYPVVGIMTKSLV